MLVVSVHPQQDIESGLVQADALISIRGTKPGYREVRLNPALFAGRILPLAFDDVPFTEFDGWKGPRRADVAAALAFARRLRADGARRLAVHCRQGKSRSAAIALAVLADQHGRGGEAEAVRSVLASDGGRNMCFHPGIVRLSDEMLGRGDAIERALEALCPPFVTWRAYWAAKAQDPRRGPEAP